MIEFKLINNIKEGLILVDKNVGVSLYSVVYKDKRQS